MRILLAIITWFLIGNLNADDQLPDLEINEIKPGVYLHKSYSQVDGFGLVSSNGLVVLDGKNAFLIDTPWSGNDTQELAEWITAQGYALSGSISTHSHDDRTAGIAWLKSKSIPTYASELTNELLVKAGEEPAENSIDESGFGLVGDDIEVFYPGAGHTIDNIVVWLPRHKLLFGGCFVRSLETGSLGYTGEARIDEWSASANRVLLKYPEAEIVIPGHGKPGNMGLLEHTRTLAETASKQADPALP